MELCLKLQEALRIQKEQKKKTNKLIHQDQDGSKQQKGNEFLILISNVWESQGHCHSCIYSNTDSTASPEVKILK